jgi:Tfp pilus assembly protein PilF
VDLGPSNLEALSDLFEYYLQAPGIVGGGLDKAENIARRVSAIDESEHHWMLARLAEKRKDWAAAEREFRAALEVAPNQVGPTLDLAAFLSSRGRYAESEAAFRDAEARSPNSPRILFARASAYIQSKRKLDEAKALLEKYLESQTTPDDPPRPEAAALLKTARYLEQQARPAE